MARRAGSGRLICENCLFIDVREWNHLGYLRAGQSFTWSWDRAGKPIGSISIRTEADAAVLTYRAQHPGEIESRPVQQRVPIVWTVCNLGGCRPWFRCTVNSACNRRAAILYGAGDLYACRHCYRLAYATSKRAQGFATLAGHGKSGCGSAAAQTCANPFQQSRTGCTDPPIIAFAHVAKPQIR
jgi:hypothetical protein